MPQWDPIIRQFWASKQKFAVSLSVQWQHAVIRKKERKWTMEKAWERNQIQQNAFEQGQGQNHVLRSDAKGLGFMLFVVLNGLWFCALQMWCVWIGGDGFTSILGTWKNFKIVIGSACLIFTDFLEFLGHFGGVLFSGTHLGRLVKIVSKIISDEYIPKKKYNQNLRTKRSCFSFSKE